LRNIFIEKELNMENLKLYIHSLVNTKYQWWTDGPTGPTAPFYAENGSPPPLNTIKANGLNCAGFMNLLRRYQGLEVPGVKEELWNAGGTYIWFRYFQERGLLKPFEPSSGYPEGTLLLRDYTSVFDQGHLAITMGMNRIAHCYPDDPNPVPNILVEPGVLIEPMNLSMSWGFNGYYTHIVAAEDWILKCDKTQSQIA
jgi:hypothetical protein